MRDAAEGVIRRVRWPLALLFVVMLATLVADQFGVVVNFGFPLLVVDRNLMGSMLAGGIVIGVGDWRTVADDPVWLNWFRMPGGGVAYWWFGVESTAYGSAISIPMWVVAAFSGAVAAIGFRLAKAMRRTGHCSRCGYAIRTTSGSVCPECGDPTATTK
jgi:hypothetical protein